MKRLDCAVGLLLLSTATAVAQTGRAGATWQTDIDLAKEERAAFLVENERLAPGEWMETALATLSFAVGEGELSLREIVRIAEAEADKNAVTEKSGEATLQDDAASDDIEDYFGLQLGREEPEQEEVWTVRFGKKPPRALKLTLTDSASTQVSCSMRELETLGSGRVGIFQNEHELVCIARDREHSG